MNAVVLYLVRHGAIISVAGKAFIGQTEAPLSEEGVEQAWALRKWLEDVPFTRIISSDLSRSRRTAQIIAGRQGCPVEAVPALREINLGDWDGLSFQEIRQRFPDEFAARGRDIENWRPPRGESFSDCRARVQAALGQIFFGSQGNVLVVGHAGVNRLILCSALGIPVRNLHSMGQDYGCVNILDFSPSGRRVRLMNYTPVPAPRPELSAAPRATQAMPLEVGQCP
jgi:probable phosphoglycerate mutase